MNLNKIAQGVLDVGTALLPMLEGTPAAAVVNAGKALVDLIQDVRQVTALDDAVALKKLLGELEHRVLAHLDRTAESLG